MRIGGNGREDTEMRKPAKRKTRNIKNRSRSLKRKCTRCCNRECAFNLFNKAKSHLIVPQLEAHLQPRQFERYTEGYLLDFKGDCNFTDVFSGAYTAHNDIISWGSPVFYKPITTKVKDFQFAYIALFLRGNTDFDQTIGQVNMDHTIERLNRITQLDNSEVRQEKARWHLALAMDLGLARLPDSALVLGPYVQRSMFNPCDLIQSSRWQMPFNQSKSLANAKLSQFDDSHNFLACTAEPMRSGVNNNADLPALLRDELCRQHATAIGMYFTHGHDQPIKVSHLPVRTLDMNNSACKKKVCVPAMG